MAGGGGLRRLLRIPRPPRQQASADLREEFELHLDLRARELVEEEGLAPEEARAEALRLFGDPERVCREMLRTATRHVRAQRGREAVWNMVRDIRYAARSLLRTPAFTAVAVATLALGIGANTAIFSVVDAVLLEPLPVPEPDRLAMIFEASQGEGGNDRNVVNPANFMDWRQRSETFQSMAAIFTIPVTVLGTGEARQVPAQLAHTDLFAVLGTPPHLGRTFSPEDGMGDGQVVVLSHSFWRDHFGGDPDVVGQTLELVVGRREVIGVMGPELEFFAPDVAFWVPTDYAWANRTSLGRYTRVVGRLAPGASLESAQSELKGIMAALATEYPEFNTRWSANVVPLDEYVKGDVRPALLVLLGAVGVLLMVTVVNMANLLLVRAASRRTEVAVRASLGAGRGRIIRELLTESLLLSTVGAALGVGLAFAVTRVLIVALPASLQVARLDQATVDLGVLLFAALVALVTGVVFGLAPAFDAFRSDLIGQLRAGGGGGGGHRARRLRSAIVVAEVALSLVLLMAAGLLLRSFLQLQSTDLGLQPENVLTGRVTMQGERYSGAESRAIFLRRSIQSIVALPEVRAAGAIAWLPLAGGWSSDGFYLPDEPVPTSSSDTRPTEVQAVAGDVFTALGMRLVRGRLFTESDAAGGRPVVIVNEALAERTWPGEDPIGKRLILTWGDPVPLEVVGVVGDVRQRTVEEQGEPSVYRPYGQFPEFGSMSLVVRTADLEGPVARQVVARVQEIDPTVAVADLKTLGDIVSEAVARPRLASFVVAAFAGLALLLAALGIYGVLAYAVSLRSQELGLRQALGARTADIAGLVLRDAFRMAAIGVVLGGVAAALGARILASQLYQVSPRDPLVFVGMPALLLAIAMVAAAIPALRATRVRPTVVIRDE